jgi:hypothetical protein
MLHAVGFGVAANDREKRKPEAEAVQFDDAAATRLPQLMGT